MLLKTPFPKDQFRVSPGRSLDCLLIRWNPATGKCTLQSFPSFTDKRQVSRDGGGQPLWRSDGKELFYLSLQGKLMAVDTTARSDL